MFSNWQVQELAFRIFAWTVQLSFLEGLKQSFRSGEPVLTFQPSTVGFRFSYLKLSTLPAFRQLEQTLMAFRFPLMVTRTLWRLGSHLLLVRLCAWLTLCPYKGFFPQISQTFAIVPFLLPRRGLRLLTSCRILASSHKESLQANSHL